MRNIFFMVMLLGVVQWTLANEVVHLPKGEQCLVANPIDISGTEYTKKDIKKTKKLCSYDMHTSVALCPKLFSSFPAVELMEIPQGMTKSYFEKNKCNKRLGQKTKGKKLAKFKFSLACSKTPSIIGYYHISRALGIKTVPVAVLRTMERESHLVIAKRGKANSQYDLSEIISRYWARLVELLKARSQRIMTPDGRYTIGALSDNPRKEQKYYGPFFPGAGGEDGIEKFKGTSLYKKISSKKHVSRMIGDQLTTQNYTQIIQMKDAVDMVILDSIFGQLDRFQNVHAHHTFLAVIDGQFKKLTLKEIEKMMEEVGALNQKARLEKAIKMPNDWKKQIVARNKVIISLVSSFLKSFGISHAHGQEMLLKDNDCGLKSVNYFKKHKVIESIYHVNKETYVQLMELYKKVKSGALDSYLKETFYMNSAEFKSFKNGLSYVAKNLNQKCRSGQLFVDLNVKSHFRQDNKESVICERI